MSSPVDEIYDNFNFEVKENSHDDNFVDISWGTKRNGVVISVPVDRVSELASAIYTFIDEIEEDDDYLGDTEICPVCGNIYCLCCGCDCMMYDEEGEDYEFD